MVRDYELMYIARPELDDEALQGAAESVEQLIRGVGGTVVRSTSWGRRRLAYEVDHLRDGHYMLLHVRVDGARVAEIERALAIHETVFRHLLVLHEAGADIEAIAEVKAPEAGADIDAIAEVKAPEAGTGTEPAAAPADGAAGDAGEPESPRQPVVAADSEDESSEDDADDEGDKPAAVLAGTEEEN
jgi:small subunit ribosomal protein S6